MPKVQSVIRILGSPRAVFDLSQNYYLRPNWDPFAREIKFLDGAKRPDVGVRVWVKAWTGLTMEVEYTSFKPPELTAVRMLRGPAFLSSFAGAWRFRPVDLEMTEVEFLYSFTTRWKRMRPVLDPIIRTVFGWDVRRRLRSLKDAIEGGQPIKPEEE